VETKSRSSDRIVVDAAVPNALSLGFPY